MNQCARCGTPIVSGRETWVHQKSSNERKALCPDCVSQLREQKRSAGAVGAAAVQTTAVASTPVQTPPAPFTTERSVLSPAIPADYGGPPKPYRPSNKVPIDGFLMLILFSLVGGLLLGVLAFALSRLIYLIVLFPLGMGLGSGFIVVGAVKWGKVRNPIIAGLFSLATGLLVYGTYWAGDYLAFRSGARAIVLEEMAAEFGEEDPVVANDIVDLVLVDEVGIGGFLGYVLLSAEEGVSIGRATSSSSFNIGTTLTWIYWLVETGIILGIAVIVAAGQASSPFCETHDRWFLGDKPVGWIGPGQTAQEAVALLQSGKTAELRQMLSGDPFIPGIEFSINRCDNCQVSNPVVTVNALSKDSKGKTKTKQLLTQPITAVQGEALL